MKNKFLHIFITLSGCLVFSVASGQKEGFYISLDKSKLTIPFTSINNLIFIDVDINGVPMVFLLDSGADKTILFSLENVEEIEFLETEKIRFRGLGNNPENVEGFKTAKNRLAITPGLVDNNHDIYIIIDEEFNISSGLGVPVNGILGFEFFKNHVIEIDYIRNKIYVYKDISTIQRKLDKRFKKLDISIENNKPYLAADVIVNNHKSTLKLLIDIGNGDAVWLFQNRVPQTVLPDNNFDDFLGRGFSGEVHGKRAKLDRIIILDYTFEQPYIAFPDTLSIKNVTIQNGAGSVGAEIIRRFTVVIDYNGKSLYLRPNSHYSQPFRFNMSGIEIHHAGLEWTQVVTPDFRSEQERNLLEDRSRTFNYQFELKPVFKIYSIRKNSPAAIAGLLKDDEIISINGKKAYKFSLQEINNLLKSREDKQIRFEVKRNDKILKYTFHLKNIL